MKKHLFYLVATIALSSFGCKKVDIDSENTIETEKICYAENNMLSFSDEFVFQSCYEAIKNSTSKELEIEKYVSNYETFSSLNDYQNQIQSNLKSSSIDDEELMDQEIKKSLIEYLAPDDDLKLLLNEKLQFKIKNEIYHITECGTFIYKEDEDELFQERYNNFIQEISNYHKENDYYTYAGIKIIDTFGHIEKGEVDIESFLQDIGFNCTENSEEKIDKNLFLSTSSDKKESLKDYKKNVIEPRLTARYNLKTVHAGYATWFNRAILGVSGEKPWHDVKLDGRHRLKVKFYNYNYKVIRSIGIKGKFQYLKHYKVRKFLLFGSKTKLYSSYVSRKADDFVIGIEDYKGVTKYEDFDLSKKYAPYIYVDKTKDWSRNLSKIAYSYVAPIGNKLMKNWVKDVYLFNTRIDVFGKNYRLMDGLTLGLDEGFKALRNEFADATDKILNKEYPPSILQLYRDDKPNWLYVHYRGVHNYGRLDKINLNIFNSGGIAISKKGDSYSVSEPKVNKHECIEASIFIAVKRNGKWAGIRFIDK